MFSFSLSIFHFMIAHAALGCFHFGLSWEYSSVRKIFWLRIRGTVYLMLTIREEQNRFLLEEMYLQSLLKLIVMQLTYNAKLLGWSILFFHYYRISSKNSKRYVSLFLKHQQLGYRPKIFVILGNGDCYATVKQHNKIEEELKDSYFLINMRRVSLGDFERMCTFSYFSLL